MRTVVWNVHCPHAMSVARVSVMFVVACSTERDPCDLSLLVECPDCPPGEVQYALPVRSFDVPASGDLMTLHCSLVRHDVQFRELSEVELQIPYMFSSFVAWGDDTYTIEADTNVSVGPGAAPRWYVASYGGDGAERWRWDLGISVYPAISFESFSAGPGGVGPWDRDGQLLDLPEVRSGDVTILKHDGRGNRTVSHQQTEPTYANVVRTLDAAGQMRWTLSIDAEVVDLAIAPAGEVAVLGLSGGGAVEIGTQRFNWLPRQQWFVALLTASGELAWATPLDGLGVDYESIVFSGSDVVVGASYDNESMYTDAPPADHGDLLLAVVAETGVQRVVPITGTSTQFLHSLRSAPDGEGVIAAVHTNARKEIRVGEHTFNEYAVVVKLRP